MASPFSVITVLSSLVLRLATFIFLRWNAHADLIGSQFCKLTLITQRYRLTAEQLPPIIFASGLVYGLSFVYQYLTADDTTTIVEDRVVVTEKRVKNTRAGNGRADGRAAQNALQPANQALERPVLEVDEIITVDTYEPSLLWSLLSGLPIPTDFTYTAPYLYQSRDLSFARMGYVDHHSAKVFLREPDADQYPISLSYRYADSQPKALWGRPDDSWKAVGGWSQLTEKTDYSVTFTVTGLQPDTRYQYAASNNQTGFFVTAPRPGHVSQRPAALGRLTFAHSSCAVPKFPYSPLQHPLSIPGFQFLAQWLPKFRPAFMLMLGDFIYIDNPRRLGGSTEDYRVRYRHVYASPDWPTVSRVEESIAGAAYDLPWVHVYDDHEIENDWDANITGLFPAAFDPYLHYHLAPNPPLPFNHRTPLTAVIDSLSPADLAHSSTPTWFSYVHGPASFFFLDTRRYRMPSNLSDPYDSSRSILGTAQRAALLTWINRPAPQGVAWKIVISSVPFTKNWRVNARDTWSGYLSERQILLESMWTANTKSSTGIVILSGDRHEFAATAFPPPRDSTQWPASATVHEFSASPLSQFYLPVRTYRQDDDEDVCLAYLPDGNSKFGIVEIEPATQSGSSILKYRLVVDGVETWSHVLVSGLGSSSAALHGVWG